MGKALISIIIPVYNAAKYLGTSLKDVTGQSYENLEIIAVNDGSSDDSLKILEGFAENDPRIRVLNKENGGSSSARNAGLKAATGDYIGFMDADDHIESDMYENLAGILDSAPETDVAQILSCEETDEGKTVKAFGEGFDKSESFTGKEFLRALLRHKGDSSFCTKLFRKEFFEGFSFSEGRLNEDFELLVSMCEKIRVLKVCERPGYHIILREQSNTRGVFKQSFYENVMENADRMIALTEEKYPDLKNEAIHFYLMQAMWFLLHIPVSEMKPENDLYVRVISKVQSCKWFILKDKDLEGKHRRNLILFAFFPAKTIKKLHESLKSRK